MADLIQRKTFPGIFDATHDHVTSSNVGNLNVFIGIELRAVLDRIQKYFAECGCDRVSFGVWKIGDLVDELEQALGSPQIAACGEADPVWRCRKNLDAFVPAWAL